MPINVEYIDHMGDDLRVANAARVSFNKRKTEFDESDAKLIQYLAKHQHKSPFNHTFATFYVKAPIFVARQLVKHEYMPWNEVSRRYVDDGLEFYFPTEWRSRVKNVKQGSGDALDTDTSIECDESLIHIREQCVNEYERLLELGVAPEMARMILPANLMTEWYWSGTMYAFAKMCHLRLDPHAQLESSLVARPISDKMTELFPVSWPALLENF